MTQAEPFEAERARFAAHAAEMRIALQKLLGACIAMDAAAVYVHTKDVHDIDTIANRLETEYRNALTCAAKALDVALPPALLQTWKDTER